MVTGKMILFYWFMIKDNKGFLYDFCKRPENKDSDYCMIKRIIPFS